MSAPEGNKFWEARSKHGRNPIFESPEDLWTSACEYFQWVEDNPLWEMKAFHFQGRVSQEPMAKLRPMTVTSLCLFLDIGSQTLSDYEKREDFSGIVKKIREIIYEQKFSGAVADLMNPNIIARDLGLRDKQDHTLSGPGGGPVETINREMTAEEAAKIYSQEVLGNG